MILYSFESSETGLPSCIFRALKTGLNRFLVGLYNFQRPKTEDRTTVTVLIGLGPVRSRSFSSLETGPSNTSSPIRTGRRTRCNGYGAQP